MIHKLIRIITLNAVIRPSVRRKEPLYQGVVDKWGKWDQSYEDSGIIPAIFSLYPQFKTSIEKIPYPSAFR